MFGTNRFIFRNSLPSRAGFTFIELIIYIALLSIVMTSAIYFAWDVVYGREKAFQQQVVDQSARIALARIGYEIRRAEDIQSVSPTQLVLDNGATTTTIELVSEAIHITSEGLGPYDLTSNQVRVTNLAFANLSNPSTDSKDIEVSMTIEQVPNNVSGQLTAATTIKKSIELNSQFNQARSLLIDLSNSSFSGNDILGMTLENTGTNDIVIDQLDISWSGTSGGENITKVQIDAKRTEWSGSQPSGSLIDLNDYTLTTTAGTVDIDYFSFDLDLTGATVSFAFVMGDGSNAQAELIIDSGAGPTDTPTPGASPTPTNTPSPTPTSTPTPTPTITPTPGATTCSSYCQSLGYTDGVCRANNGQCNQNGETGESGGNQYCTGGPSADTCCCQP